MKQILALLFLLPNLLFSTIPLHDTLKDGEEIIVQKHYDVLIIGGGAGTKLIRPLANKGLKVAVVEREKLGGTCLNRGCIPSKMLIHPAELLASFKNLDRFNLHKTGEIKPDFSKLVERVNHTIDEESEGIVKMYAEHPNVDAYFFEAKFVSNDTVRGNGIELTGDKVFIAVGARAQIPNIEGLDQVPYFTYREALRNKKLPKKLLVLGGGYIALELGFFYSALGSDTHFFVRSKLLKNEDMTIQEEFQRYFTSHNNVHLERIPTKVSHKDGIFTLTFDDGEIIEGDALLVATGVTSWADTLALENTDVKVDDRGFIIVDDHLKTTAPNIWAYGDCIGHSLFRHTANFEGEYLLRSLFTNPSNEPIDYTPIPHAVFTHPQIGGVGKTEQQLKAEGIDYFVGTNSYKKSAKGMAILPDVGLVKLLFDRKSHKLLGGHILGEESATMVHMLIAYMTMDATLEDMLKTIYIHPALPENIRNAARDAKAKCAMCQD